MMNDKDRDISDAPNGIPLKAAWSLWHRARAILVRSGEVLVVGAPMTAILYSAGAAQYDTYVTKLLSGNPEQMTSVGIAALAGVAGTTAMRSGVFFKKQEHEMSGLTSLVHQLLQELRDTQRTLADREEARQSHAEEVRRLERQLARARRRHDDLVRENVQLTVAAAAVATVVDEDSVYDGNDHFTIKRTRPNPS